jgi:hypothetical protein
MPQMVTFPSLIRGNTNPDGAASKSRGWRSSFVLGVLLVTIYSVNGRELCTTDTAPTTMLPLTILRGQGVYLDSQSTPIPEPSVRLTYAVVRRNSHILSRYPVAPALLIVPLVAPQVALLDFRHPGWDRNPTIAANECKWMAKRSLAVLMALAGVILYRYLIAIGLARTALPAALAATLGSDLWTVGSQALWQHGPAAFCLILAVALLQPEPVPRSRLVLSGLAATGLYACRLMDVLFTLILVFWVARTQRRGLLWFLPAPIVGAIVLACYNLVFFDSLAGGQSELEALHPQLHGVKGAFSGNLIVGAAGTLFSPSRGLLVFSPWIAVALAAAAVPDVARRVGSNRLITWLLLALVPYLVFFSKYSVWWGGHCFGPRYWTDAIPLFAILLAYGLDWMVDRSRFFLALATGSIVVSIAIQCIGAFCYPSMWNQRPVNVDLHHERLWDWRDTELSRCLSEAFAPQAR